MFKENLKFAIALLFIIAGALLFNNIAEQYKAKHVTVVATESQDKQFQHIMETLDSIEKSIKKLEEDNEGNSKK